MDYATMSDEELAAMLAQAGQFSPEELQALGTDGAALRALFGAQRGTGEAMFATPGAQGMNVGGTYKASSPLEHMAVALQRAMGGRQMRKAEGDISGSVQSEAGTYGMAQQRRLALEALQAELDRRRNQPPQMPGPAGWGNGY